MLNYEEFRKVIVKELKNIHPEYVFTEELIKKFNECYYGIAIRSKNANCGPVIDLTGYYQNYLEKQMTLHEVQWEIWDRYREALSHIDEIMERAKSMGEFETAKNMIYCKVINKSMNEEFIHTIPCRTLPALNLLCTYYIDFGPGITCTVNNRTLNYWGIDEHAIHNIAIDNMKKNCIPYCIRITELLKCEAVECEDEEFPMWVVGLKKDGRIYAGANIIILREVLNDILDKNNIPKHCYIIPSSIHELIIVPANGKVTALNNMIKHVNETEALKSDILSDVGFYFDREKDEVSILKWIINAF